MAKISEKRVRSMNELMGAGRKKLGINFPKLPSKSSNKQTSNFGDMKVGDRRTVERVKNGYLLIKPGDSKNDWKEDKIILPKNPFKSK
ncbi:MAG: hypothetical protein WC358_08300 [Ignavibacteria bacterium]|jgi:hypothetical protein